MTQFVTAVYRGGQLVLETPVNWPEGQKVYLAAAVDPATLQALDWRPEETELTDDPVANQARANRLLELEPLVMTDQEFAEWEAAREEVKRVTLAAVRKEMGLAP